MPASSLVFRAAAILLALSVALPAAAATLYADLGAQPGLVRIVDGLLDRALADARIKHTFEDTNVPRLKRLLVDQLCEITGGPCRYTGRDMVASHADLGLSARHFNALVEDLQDAMDAEGIPFRTQNRLLALLAPMHRDMVGVGAAQ